MKEISQVMKGSLTEIRCITAFMENNIEISIPYGNNARYDFILDTGTKLLRIQVKSSAWNDDHSAFNFNGYSQHSLGNGNKRMKYTNKEIDYFMTEKDGQFYLYPATEDGFASKCLRVFSDAKNQTQINWAKDYLFEEVSKSF